MVVGVVVVPGVPESIMVVVLVVVVNGSGSGRSCCCCYCSFSFDEEVQVRGFNHTHFQWAGCCSASVSLCAKGTLVHKSRKKNSYRQTSNLPNFWRAAKLVFIFHVYEETGGVSHFTCPDCF